MGNFKRFFIRAFMCVVPVILGIFPGGAWADAMPLVDKLNLAPFVPIVLDALMAVATGGYEFFVGNGDGMIYIFVWGFLAISMGLYLLKMYFPKTWVGFFGFSGGGQIDGGEKIVMNILKPGLRGIIAAGVLLQLQPVVLTKALVNPFLEFGALYTHAITESISDNIGGAAPKMECPQDILEHGWISKDSCEYLVQPVSDISHANNQVIKNGFEFFLRGLRGLMTPIPHGGQDFLNIITGIILIFTFVASNIFMAMLIIQAIFDFGMALILYPFQVLTYVVKSSDKWFDIWPAFDGITKALQRLVITMIACAFILAVNIALIRSMFNWGTSVYSVAAGASATSNVPTIASSAGGFGEHSIMWMSAILTFYLMFKIFDMTRAQLMKYTGSGSDAMYKQVTADAKRTWDIAKSARDWVKEAKWLKNKAGK